MFESIVVKWVDDSLLSEIDDKQFGGITGTSTTDALVEMANMRYEATDKLDVLVRVILLDFSKAFDLINHRILIEKLHSFGIPSHILRWSGQDRTQKVKVLNYLSSSVTPSGGVPQGTLLGPKCFLTYINDLYTPCPLFKYVDDSTICEICDRKSASIIQESVDITARWVEQNDMRINSVKGNRNNKCNQRLKSII